MGGTFRGIPVKGYHADTDEWELEDGTMVDRREMMEAMHPPRVVTLGGKLPDMTPGQVLMSDSSGNAQWADYSNRAIHRGVTNDWFVRNGNNPYSMLADRLRLTITPGATGNWDPLTDLHIGVDDLNAYVFYVKDHQAGILTDPANLFPSDELIAAMKLVMQR